MMKITHLAEVSAMNCEVLSGYNASGHVHRSGQDELDHLDYGLVESFHIDGDGLLQPPTRPGLGTGVDWDLIGSAPAGVVQ
jgi:L-alanine-DL-glutamate epimerase-like enolase superfamily enzyme